MLCECFIEGGGVPFLADGKTFNEARVNALAFLEDRGLPTENLRLKKYRRKKKKALGRQKQPVMARE